MSFLWSVLWYLVAVGFLVIVHEFGHFWVARRLGFKVLRFSIGFGKPLVRKLVGKDATEIVLAPIPMGGYVKMLDEREGPVPPQDLPRSFTRRPPWQRILVLLAGPGFNVLFAIAVLWGMFWVNGMTNVKPIVGEVTVGSQAARAGLHPGDDIIAIDRHAVADQRDVVFDLLDAVLARGQASLTVRGENGQTRAITFQVPSAEDRRRLTEPSMLMSGLGFRFQEPPIPPVLGQVVAGGPAARAGLRAGDRITRIDGLQVRDFRDIAHDVSDLAGKRVSVEYVRAGVSRSTELVPITSVENGQKVVRIQASSPLSGSVPLPASMISHVRLSPLGALSAATGEAWNLTAMQGRLLYRMVLGQVSLKNLSGPISIAEFAGESATAGAGDFLSFLVLISLAIALFNLLPIPILDGGQIVFQAAEWIKGRPLSERAQVFGQQVGIALLVLLLGVALFNDVSRVGFGPLG
ncbi:MAG TPA: RIP metalloprotease RseP [Steroidobacteraceae bacterium]|nr:RIP metalloprotease RseP [Steroidobacteraceae bacterium]